MDKINKKHWNHELEIVSKLSDYPPGQRGNNLWSPQSAGKDMIYIMRQRGLTIPAPFKQKHHGEMVLFKIFGLNGMYANAV